MNDTNMICDCCGRSEDIAGVASSALYPVSLCYCINCASNYAEPNWLCDFFYEDCGGNAADWVIDSITVFYNGNYLSWNNYFESRNYND